MRTRWKADRSTFSEEQCARHDISLWIPDLYLLDAAAWRIAADARGWTSSSCPQACKAADVRDALGQGAGRPLMDGQWWVVQCTDTWKLMRVLNDGGCYDDSQRLLERAGLVSCSES